ncbi:MAG: hypothetical protein RL071_4500 [Pseudomonadota bacterium]
MPPFDLLAHTLLLCISGSRAYGLHTATSDVDLKGALLPPRRQLLGLRPLFPQVDDAASIAAYGPLLRPEEQAAAARTKLEGSVYGVQKLIELAADCNPNVLELLFCREDELRLVHPAGALLRAQRDLFLSQRAARTFAGYARAQLQRIELHRGWLLHPPTRQPTRADFGLPERTLLPADQLAAAEAAVTKALDSWTLNLDGLPAADAQRMRDQRDVFVRESLGGAEALARAAAAQAGLPINVIELMERERRYTSAQRRFGQYIDWQRSRNPDRAALEAAHGYDTKHAAHLLRLLRMGGELMEEGALRVWRGDIDAAELLEVRAGAWSYERLLAEAKAGEARLAAVVAAGRCPLPPTPDPAAVEALCGAVIEACLGAPPWSGPRG